MSFKKIRTIFAKIKNTFLTPHYINFHKNVEKNLEKKGIKKTNKLINFLFKFLWFLPNLESSKYWSNRQADDGHGYKKYLEIDSNSRILINEIKIRANKNDKILDLCCNIGRHLNALTEMGYSNLFGVDINNLAIEKMKTTFKNINTKNIFHENAESYLLKTGSNFFDVVYTYGATVELIPPTFPLVNEICRVSKKFVIFLIEEDGHAYPRFWRYEFKRNNMNLIYSKNFFGPSLLVYEKTHNR
tara:strand:- start:1163 stop:1894 length:732 start_codon:yes stop_codon:yes gene_type:complete